MTRAIRYPQFLPSAFHPLPELKVQNADVVLLLVYKGKALYMTQVNDPLFAAHQPRDLLDVQNAINRTFYTSDTLLSVLGCTEQVCPRISSTPNQSMLTTHSTSSALLMVQLLYLARS